MKKIFIVRHAKSSWEHPGLKDFERPLNERGLRDAPLMGKRLKDMGAAPDLIISSPATRAFGTAQFFAQALDYTTEIIVEPTLYVAEPADFIRLIQKLDNSLSEVFIFGHNPTITDLVNHYSDQTISNVPTCGVALLEAEIGDWEAFVQATVRVRHFLYPKMFSDASGD